MNKVIIMIGLQGSGKTTRAKEILKYQEEVLLQDTVLLSSDKYRKNNPELDNNKIFELLYKDANKALLEKKDVIIDATNITRKSRTKIYNSIKVPVTYHLMIMATPFTECVARVNKRNKGSKEHYIPLEVLKKYALSFEMVTPSEPFATIEIIGNNSNMIEYLIGETIGFEQKSKYHDHTLDKHMELVTEEIKKRTSDKVLTEAAKLHDIGKVLTQTFGEDGNAHYYGHANVGAYEILTSTQYLMEKLNLNHKEFIKLVNVVNYHMNVYQWQTDKAKNKWRKILGEELYENLIVFNQADKGGKQ